GHDRGDAVEARQLLRALGIGERRVALDARPLLAHEHGDDAEPRAVGGVHLAALGRVLDGAHDPGEHGDDAALGLVLTPALGGTRSLRAAVPAVRTAGTRGTVLGGSVRSARVLPGWAHCSPRRHRDERRPLCDPSGRRIGWIPGVPAPLNSEAAVPDPAWPVG